MLPGWVLDRIALISIEPEVYEATIAPRQRLGARALWAEGRSAAAALRSLVDALLLERASRHEPEGSDAPYHSLRSCSAAPCPYHNPSGRGRPDLPILFDASRGGLCSRRCTHGALHPDPDSVDWCRRHYPDPKHRWGEHTCDGCCRSR